MITNSALIEIKPYSHLANLLPKNLRSQYLASQSITAIDYVHARRKILALRLLQAMHNYEKSQKLAGAYIFCVLDDIKSVIGALNAAVSDTRSGLMTKVAARVKLMATADIIGLDQKLILSALDHAERADAAPEPTTLLPCGNRIAEPIAALPGAQ